MIKKGGMKMINGTKFQKKFKIKDSKMEAFQFCTYLLPAFLLIFGFMFYPAFKTFYLSFFLTDTRGNPIEFVGLENFIEVLSEPEFYESLYVSFKFSFIVVTLQILIALILALISFEKIRGIKVFRTIFSLPLGVSSAAASVVWLFFYNPSIGLLNRFLGLLGFKSVNWITDPRYALWAVSIATVWMGLGFSYLVYLGALHGVDEEIYESAKIDGASYFVTLLKITLPLISPTTLYLVIINTLKAFQSFAQIDVLTGGGPLKSTNILIYDVYQTAFVAGKYDIASTLSVILFIILSIITIIQFKFEKKVHY